MFSARLRILNCALCVLLWVCLNLNLFVFVWVFVLVILCVCVYVSCVYNKLLLFHGWRWSQCFCLSPIFRFIVKPIFCNLFKDFGVWVLIWLLCKQSNQITTVLAFRFLRGVWPDPVSQSTLHFVCCFHFYPGINSFMLLICHSNWKKRKIKVIFKYTWE